jgi:hypothetical protein
MRFCFVTFRELRTSSWVSALSDSNALVVKAAAFAAAAVAAVACFAEMSASCAEMDSREGAVIIDRPLIGL